MPKRKLPPSEKVVEMYQSGMSCGEIAEECEVAPVTVTSLLRRLQVPRRSCSEAAAIRVQRGRCRSAKYWEGKKQSQEMVERRVSKIRGERHYNWKGGESRRPYRNLRPKVECAVCCDRASLGIHHKDFDHFNNNPENLQVLCVSCHMSFHKQAYWDAYHANEPTPRSNGPVGWAR